MAVPIARSSAQLPKWIVGAATVLLLLVVAYGDYVTPPDMSFALFYILPVALATWVLGRRSGYIMACVGTVSELLVELYGTNTYKDIKFAYWNALTRLAFFLFSVPVLWSWRTMGERLKKMVEERTAELRAEVAERQRAEQSVRELAAQLSAVEDAERRRFAHDLHDGLGQMLSLLKMNLEAARSGAQGIEGTGRLGERMADSVQMVDTLIQQTRSLTFDLHPAMLDDLGLVATLEGYGRDFDRRVGIDVTVTEHGQARQLPTTIAHYLFRAVKELLNNAARHGKAKEIVITVHWEPMRIRVVIDDDGLGFHPLKLQQRPGPRGLGLPGIKERLQSLGGAIHIESSPGQGARVILEARLEPVRTADRAENSRAPARDPEREKESSADTAGLPNSIVTN
jgi:signal transduction histidine kinase